MVQNVRQPGSQRYRETFGRSCEGTNEMQRIIIAAQLLERNPA